MVSLGQVRLGHLTSMPCCDFSFQISVTTKNPFAAVSETGKFVLVKDDHTIYWSGPSMGNSTGAVTSLQNDGVITVKSKGGQILWKSPIFVPCT